MREEVELVLSEQWIDLKLKRRQIMCQAEYFIRQKHHVQKYISLNITKMKSCKYIIRQNTQDHILGGRYIQQIRQTREHTKNRTLLILAMEVTYGGIVAH